MVMLAGGAHVGLDAVKGVALIDTAMRLLRRDGAPNQAGLAKGCNSTAAPDARTHVLWLGMLAVQTTWLDDRYPHQSAARVAEYERETAAHAQRVWSVPSLLLSSLSTGAPTSDGLHKLTDANVAMAHAVLHAMSLF